MDANGQVDLKACRINMATKKMNDLALLDELSQLLGHFCMNSEHSDVTFIVDDEKIFAHKNILAMRSSSYFRGLFYGGLAESSQREIKLKVPLEAFKATLKYMYTGCMSLNEMGYERILEVLGLAEQYGLESLKLAISSYLTGIVSQENCCKILNAAKLYNLGALSSICFAFMDRNATELLTLAEFLLLSQDSLCTLLERDSFYAPEIEIFKAVEKWYENNPTANIQMVISKVRLPLMDLNQLFEVVRACLLVSSDSLLDAIRSKTTSTNIRCRGVLCTLKNYSDTAHMELFRWNF